MSTITFGLTIELSGYEVSTFALEAWQHIHVVFLEFEA